MSTLAPDMTSGSQQFAVNATQSVAVNTTQQAIFNAWAVTPTTNNTVISFWIVFYLFTIIPSILGAPFITFGNLCSNFFLFSDMLFKLFNAQKIPIDPSLWSIENWLSFSFRRWIVDWLIAPLNYLTQLIPIANWLLNLIPLYLHYANSI